MGELVAGIAGLALIIFMFLPWFSSGVDVPTSDVTVPNIPGVEAEDAQDLVPEAPEVDDDVSAWDSLTDFDGFLIAAAGVSGIALMLLAATGQRVNLGGVPRGSVTAALGALAVALILWRMLSGPGDVEYGIFLGLAAAIGVAAGSALALRDSGVGVTVAAAGRPRATGASAPASRRRGTSSRSTASRSSTRKTSGTRKRSSRSSGGRKSSSRRSSSSGRSSSGGRSRRKRS